MIEIIEHGGRVIRNIKLFKCDARRCWCIFKSDEREERDGKYWKEIFIKCPECGEEIEGEH